MPKNRKIFLETKGKYGRRKSNKNGKLENSVGRNNGGVSTKGKITSAPEQIHGL